LERALALARQQAQSWELRNRADLLGAGSAREQTAIGETPNLAARLQALAEPDACVIAESMRRQIGSLFQLHDLGPQQLKGFAEPQRAWYVVAENRALGFYFAP
jgi:class 3 adenylate cyclase